MPTNIAEYLRFAEMIFEGKKRDPTRLKNLSGLKSILITNKKIIF